MERTGGGNPQDGVPPMEGVSGGGKGYGWNDDGLHGLNILGGSVDPTMFPSGDLLHVWCMPSTANIGKQEAPRSFEPTLPISILAARNERESFQIALRPKVSWGCPGIAGIVKVYCTDLCSASGESLVVGKSVTLRHVVPILGVPDALVPLDLPVSQITLFPGETTAIWVSIDVPAEQPPGEYEGDFFITAMKAEPGNSAQFLTKDEKNQIFRELKNCLGVVESLEHKPMENVGERLKSISTALRRVILSPTFTEISSDNGPAFASLSVHLRLSMTVWDFVLPRTPSLPAVFGISETVIKDRFGVKYGSDEWYEALDQHFKWLLQYRISPFFCRWGDSMRVLAYTCPWPANHPKAEEYYSDPRLAAYAVPYPLVLSGVGNASSNGHTDHGLTSLNATIGLLTCNITDIAKDALKKEIDILRTKTHWKKAYFYLWDKPLKLDNYNSMRNMASEIRTYALDARVLTTYFCECTGLTAKAAYSGQSLMALPKVTDHRPSDAPLAPTAFEAFVKVPSFLRPHTQIFCTSEWALGNREDLAKDIIAELQPEIGEEWWTYVGMGPSDPQPNWHLGMRGTQHRAVMWRVWKEGGTGFFYWGANCYEKATVPSAEIQFTSRGLPPGDGILFYPGEVFSSSHEPVASVRLERILSGLQDIEYLKLFASVYGRDKGLSLLEKTGVYLGPERYTLEHMPIDVMRGEIFRTCRSRRCRSRMFRSRRCRSRTCRSRT